MDSTLKQCKSEDHKLLFSVCSKTYLLTRIYSQLKQPTSIKVEKKKRNVQKNRNGEKLLPAKFMLKKIL